MLSLGNMEFTSSSEHVDFPCMSGDDKEYQFGSIQAYNHGYDKHQEEKQMSALFQGCCGSISVAFCAGFTDLLHVCKLILKNVKIQQFLKHSTYTTSASITKLHTRKSLKKLIHQSAACRRSILHHVLII